MKTRAAVAGTILGLAVLAACGDDSEVGTRASADSGNMADEECAEPEGELEEVVDLDSADASVRAQDNTFVEENIRVEAGTTVGWENVGRQDHDVLPADDCDWGVEVADFTPGEAYEHTFDEPGTYRYYCSLHGTPDAGMRGTVVVE